MSDGIPAYITIDMATQNTELVKLDQYTEDMGLDLSVDSGMDLYL